MHINLHEINKHLKTHSVSSEDFQDVLNSDDKFTTARKPKETVETVSAWSLRTNTNVNTHEKVFK